MKGIIGLVAALLAIGAIAIFATNSVSANDQACTLNTKLNCPGGTTSGDKLSVTNAGGNFELAGTTVDADCISGTVQNSSNPNLANTTIVVFRRTADAYCGSGAIGGVADFASVDAAAAVGSDSSSDSNTALWASIAAATTVAAVAVGGGVLYVRRRAN